MYVYSWFIVLTESLLTVRLAVSEIKPVQSLTDRQTDRQADRIVNYSNSRCACARGLMTMKVVHKIMAQAITTLQGNRDTTREDGREIIIRGW